MAATLRAALATSVEYRVELKRYLSVDGSLTSVASAPGEPDKLYLVQKAGKILVYDKLTGQIAKEPFLDITAELTKLFKQNPFNLPFADERGLLRLVFHPEYATRGSLYRGVFLTAASRLADPSAYDELSAEQVPNPDCMTCISQYFNRNNAKETLKTRKDLLCVPEPQANHNGGSLAFDAEGLLWVGFGDGGGAGDQHGPLLDPTNPNSYLGFAQDLQSYHGKLLRIQVVQPMPQETPYVIPPTNPFYNKVDIARPEIAAYGFRNPWSICADGPWRMLVGDVGQNTWESVKAVRQLGENHGWRAMEGHHVFSPEVRDFIKQRGGEIVPPLLSYGREHGVAITGLQYITGDEMPALKDKIVLGDYSGKVHVFDPDTQRFATIADLGLNLSGMARDADGTVYVIGYDVKTKKGVVYRLGPLNGEKGPFPILSASEIQRITEQGISKANTTRSGIRRDVAGVATSAKVHVAVLRRETTSPLENLLESLPQSWTRDVILRGMERASRETREQETRERDSGQQSDRKHKVTVVSMPDAWEGSVDIAEKKAHTAFAFSSDENALTSRTVGELSQPGGPLWQIGHSNPNGGVIEFPGGVPLYKNGRLVGAVGVSGDVVDVDEAIALAAARGFEPPHPITADKVGLVYTKEESVESRGDLGSDLLVVFGRGRLLNLTDSQRSLVVILKGDAELDSINAFSALQNGWSVINIVSLDVSDTPLSNLEGIANFSGLRELNLSRTRLDDVSLRPLYDVTWLTRLELAGNDVSNIEFVRNMLQLRRLGLSCTLISDIRPVEVLEELESLDLYATAAVLDDEDGRNVVLPRRLRRLDIRHTDINPDFVREQFPHITDLVYH